MAPDSNRTFPSANAFSLIELAIVLAILGLLTGAILGGRALLDGAELRQTLGELQKYRSAYLQFNDQYNAMPGDMSDATTIWGADPNGCPTHSTRVPGKATCDGNNDGVIAAEEIFRAWQHLSNAELVEGTYTGVAGVNGSAHAVPGANVPSGQLERSGYSIRSLGLVSGNANYYANSSEAEIYLGESSASNYTYVALFEPEQQYSMDVKIDDGKPSTGALRSFKSPLNPSCTTSDDETAEIDYQLDTQTPACTLIYVLE